MREWGQIREMEWLGTAAGECRVERHLEHTSTEGTQSEPS